MKKKKGITKDLRTKGFGHFAILRIRGRCFVRKIGRITSG